METLFTYFIKVSVLVALFYLSYHFLLKRETFFSKNRLFLLLGLVTSVILPIVTITKTVWVEPVVFEEPFILSDFPVMITEQQKTEINWSYIVAGFYLLGMLFFLVKFILSSLSLYKILHKSPITKQNGFKFIDSKNVKTPFSFFNYIAFDSSSFSEEELQNIITHEKVHSKQKHSFDIILSEIFSIVFWLNPFVWLYKKAIQQNLEFIADNKAVKTSENKVNYQKTLLKITLQSENQPALANLFYQSLIKKRIIMLNKNQSKNRSLWKFTFILPILVVFVIQFQTKVVAQEKTTVISQEKEQQYRLPISTESKYAKDTLVIGDTIVWVKDFSRPYDDWTNQSTGEKFVLQADSAEEVKAIIQDKEFAYKKLGKNPLIIVNGKEIGNKDFVLNNKDVLLNNMDILSFKTKGTVTHYDKESAVKKFGEKAKDGAIVIEEKDTKVSFSSTEKELIKFLKSAKDYTQIYIFNRWGVLMYTLKPNEKIDEQKLNALDDGTYYYAIEKKSGEKENGYVYKGDKSATTKQSDREQRLKEREELLAERKEIERQAREKSGLSDEEIQKRTEKLEERKKMLEERRKGLGKRLEEKEVQIQERKKMIEEKRKERKVKLSQYEIDVTGSYSTIGKNSSDSDIESIKSEMQKSGIQMKVSNLKRNKNGEIYKITISLTENSGTENNKQKAKSEATFERENEAIPNIFVGKQNGSLIVSSSIR